MKIKYLKVKKKYNFAANLKNKLMVFDIQIVY